MSHSKDVEQFKAKYIIEDDHAASDYFSMIKELVKIRNETSDFSWQTEIDTVYAMVRKELVENHGKPLSPLKFGTSGWRGILGKDVFARSIGCVTAAIVEMYRLVESDPVMTSSLGVQDFDEAKKRGCVLGYDNRFGGELLARAVVKVLTDNGFTVYYSGESTTGALSAAVLELHAAFSINLTPSHNPLEYGGYKFNAADAGPAAAEVTETITRLAREIIDSDFDIESSAITGLEILSLSGVTEIRALDYWKTLVRKNVDVHGIDYDQIVKDYADATDLIVAIDSVHGASRNDICELLEVEKGTGYFGLRDTPDVTFGGIAPEPSSANIKAIHELLAGRSEKYRVGAIIDPDGDRIRFTDGREEISMNQFGAMAYHFLVVHKKKKGMVAKTVATSNMANQLAESFGEKVFEPRVGFKEFKPVMGKALVFFEESDGISIIGHTPEKDAYIGLLLALDMVLTTGKNLSEYKDEIEAEFGAFYADRDGIEVSYRGEELLERLKELEKYGRGSSLIVGGEPKEIVEVITIDGRKMILDDGSWLMIRPSGTEPKVRFYVESRTPDGTQDLVETAQRLLREIQLV
ncbi:phosphoglucomutase [Desulfosediminicola ganghwensis]|uniref:phosphoglucomutase n=1 Tax=Desulfosediminicola ganghwensis TaxID=2569540 RepID=UPI0010AC4C8B|nr:phosphoglucomutase [Desulfosediminicola ganghwensis]